MRASGWLRVAAAALTGTALVQLLLWAFTLRAWTETRPGSPAAARQLEVMERVLPPIFLLGMLVMGAALLLFAVRSPRRELKVPALVACVLGLAWCAISTLDWTSILFGWPPWLRYQGHWKLAAWTENIVNLAVPLALLALAHRAWRSMSGMRLAVLALGVSWSFGLPLWAIAARSFDPSWVVAPSLGWSLLLIYGAAAATLLGLAAALRRAAGAVDAGEDDGYRGWSDVAAGLRVYGDALAWRIGLTFVGLLLLFMAGMARSVALAGLFGALLPFALLLSALVMLAGLARYASQPPGSPGRAPAWIAFAGLVMGMALDLFGLVIVIKMIGGSREHLTEALRDRSTSLTRWGLICGGVSFASLLISFAAVAVHLRRPDMLRKVVGLVTFLILASAVLAAFLVYGVSDLGTAVLAVIGLLILLLLFALAYLRLVRTMEGAVALGGDGGLPQARVV